MNPMEQFLGINSYEHELGVKLIDFWNEQSIWSQETFGSDSVRGPQGPIKHIIKECNEVLENPKDLKEYVDIGVLLCDATRRAGFTLEQLVNGMYDKLQENKSRQWPKCTDVQYTEAYQNYDGYWSVGALRDGEIVCYGQGKTSIEASEDCRKRVQELPVEHIRK
jgi:hypothetical protein